MKPILKKETLDELITETEQDVFEDPISQHNPNEHLGVKKISLNDNFIKIDFVYIAQNKYVNGGNIQIDSRCFIRPITSKTVCKTVSSITISIGPSKYHCKAKRPVQHFSFLFPALPKNVKQIDIIERLVNLTYFNFLKVALQHQELTLINIINKN